MASCLFTLVGCALSFWIGVGHLGHPVGDVIWALLASQLAAAIGLPATLYIQRNPRLRFLVRGPLRSWLMLSFLYLGVMLGVCPWLREPVAFAWMFFPLLWSIGVTLLIYGPIHDRVLRRKAR
jgi:hypothetical protein